MQTLKYKTRSSIMLNRFEAFNLSIMSKMQNRRRPQAHVLLSTTPAQAGVPADTHGHSAGGAGTMSDVVMADTPAAQTGTAGGAGAGGGGAKKKKPKKKK
jgi:signal recognition particle subunit SRP9